LFVCSCSSAVFADFFYICWPLDPLLYLQQSKYFLSFCGNVYTAFINIHTGLIRDGICTLDRSHKFPRKIIVLTRLHRWQQCVSNCAPEEYKFNLAAYFNRKGRKGGKGTKGIKNRIEETEEEDRWKWLLFEFQCTFYTS
jgi:hypothetical protein